MLDWMDNFFIFDFSTSYVFFQGFTSNCDTITLNGTFFDQLIDNGWYTTSFMHIMHGVNTRRCNFRKIRCLLSNLVNIFEIIVNPCFTRNSECMKHSIGRTTHGHIERKGIVDGFFGHNIPWTDTLFNILYQLFGCLANQFPAFI